MGKVRRCLLSAVLVTMLCGPSAGGGERPAEQQAPWKVGLAAAKVTPRKPVYLSGYASRNHPFESVEADLYVKAMALEDEAGHRAVLVTADIIGFRIEMSRRIWTGVKKATGLEPHQVLLNASHTHTGPSVSLDPTPTGRNQTEQQARDTVEYTNWLIEQVIDTVRRACEDMRPARLSYGLGVALFVMNRREFTPRGVRLGVNPRGLADRGVPVLRVDDAHGKPRAVVFGVACHNTTLTGRHYFICGDFAGYAQSEIQERYPGLQAMFVQNCGGSANPYPRGTLEASKAHGHELAQEIGRLLEAKLRPVRGPLRTLLEDVALPLEPAPSAEELKKLTAAGGWRAWVGRKMAEAAKKGERLPESYSAPVALWQFGHDLTLVGLPCEVVIEYVPLIEKAIGPLNLWIAAYCNDVAGYIPSRQVLEEGGYETRGLYAGVGFFKPETEEILVKHVRKLAEAAGRSLPK